MCIQYCHCCATILNFQSVLWTQRKREKETRFKQLTFDLHKLLSKNIINHNTVYQRRDFPNCFSLVRSSMGWKIVVFLFYKTHDNTVNINGTTYTAFFPYSLNKKYKIKVNYRTQHDIIIFLKQTVLKMYIFDTI